MTAAIYNNGGSQFDVIIGGVVTGTFDGTGFTGVKDASITAAKLADAVKPIGVGQTEQVVTGSRTLGVTYTNTTGRAIRLTVETSTAVSVTASAVIYRNGIEVTRCYHSVGSAQLSMSISADIHNGDTYSVTGANIAAWRETR